MLTLQDEDLQEQAKVRALQHICVKVHYSTCFLHVLCSFMFARLNYIELSHQNFHKDVGMALDTESQCYTIGSEFPAGNKPFRLAADLCWRYEMLLPTCCLYAAGLVLGGKTFEIAGADKCNTLWWGDGKQGLPAKELKQKSLTARKKILKLFIILIKELRFALKIFKNKFNWI